MPQVLLIKEKCMGGGGTMTASQDLTIKTTKCIASGRKESLVSMKELREQWLVGITAMQ